MKLAIAPHSQIAVRRELRHCCIGAVVEGGSDQPSRARFARGGRCRPMMRLNRSSTRGVSVPLCG
jgi:hypothetical protein